MFKQCFATLLAASVISIAAPLASAQDNSSNSQQQSQPSQDMGRERHGRPDPAERTAHLTKKLNLTSDQQAKVLQILQSEQSQMQSAHQDSSTSQQDRHAKMMDIRKSTDAQIRAVLDSNQQKQWDEMQANREKRGENHQGPPPPQQ
jgi:Spy/CpxP family protein refolding chaperone